MDRTIAEVAAAHGGRYDVDTHLRHDPGATQTYAEAHVRLEAMWRGGGGVTREASGQWRIAPDHLARVAAREAKQIADRPVAVTGLSATPIDRMIEAEAATWIDRELAGTAPMPLRDAGFGHELREAMDQRQRWLLAQGFAQENGGDVMVTKATLQLLQRRELLRVGEEMAGEVGKPFQEAALASRVSGALRGPVETTSGRFALIERAHDFTLVPWAKVLERRAGQTVSGLVREAGINWSIARGRDGPTIS